MIARIRKYFGLTEFSSDAFPSALALFFGSFALLNLIVGFRSPGFDANLWWIDLRLLPPFVANSLIAFVSVVLIAFSVRPPISRPRQFVTAGCAFVVLFLALVNTGQFYRELFAGSFKSHFPIPLSLFIGAAFFLIVRAAFRPRATVLNFSRGIGLMLGLAFCAFAFPLLQVFCFGKTDYRRSTDVAVVLGARAYADGTPSDALADRVRTAVDLYKQGLVKKLLMSGGPGDGTIHETEAMRRFAVKLGVPSENILADENGVNTQATVKNTEPMLQQLHAQRVLVVSHFYHLPRIKLAYHRDGWEVYTVPATETYFLRETPYMVLREVAALWVYYLRPLRHS